MTAIGYVSPGNRPALVTDTIVSVDDPSVSSPVPGSRISIDEEFEVRSVIGLTSKVYLLRPNVAVCCSGLQDSIIDYLTYAPALIDRYPDRPTLELANYANQFSGLSVVGAAFAGGKIRRFGGKHVQFKLPYLNDCMTEGSGRIGLRNFFEMIDRNIPEAFPLPPAHPYFSGTEFRRGFCNSLTARTIWYDAERSGAAGYDWGGFFEWAIMGEDGTWQKTEDALVLHYVCFVDADDVAYFALYGDLIVYRNVGDHALILLIRAVKRETHSWTVRNILSDAESPPVELPPVGWKPKNIILTLSAWDEKTGRRRRVYRSLAFQEAARSDLTFGKEQLYVKLLDGFIENLFGPICRSLNKEVKLVRPLDEARMRRLGDLLA